MRLFVLFMNMHFITVRIHLNDIIFIKYHTGIVGIIIVSKLLGLTIGIAI